MTNWNGGPGWGESGPWTPEAGHGWKVFLKLADYNDPGPSGTFVFLDEREDSINDGYFVVAMQGYPRENGAAAQAAQLKIVDFPASYHNGAGGLTFADGHSEIKKWVESTTKVINGNVSRLSVPGSRDWAWIAERSTARNDGAPFL